MLTLIEELVYAGRFGLEVVTVLALIGGGLIKGKIMKSCFLLF